MRARLLLVAFFTLTASIPARPSAQSDDCEDRPASNFKTRKASRPGGPTQGTEKAVLDGLRWLVRHQNPDGSWRATTLDENCRDSKQVYSGHFDEGLTALALLGFLGAGYHQHSTQDLVDTVLAKRYRIGEVVEQGIQWLLKRQPADGLIQSEDWSFPQHAIVTLALCESYALSGDPETFRGARRAVNTLLRWQPMNPSGSGKWGFGPTPSYFFELAAKRGEEQAKRRYYEADLITTTWSILALHSARQAGIPVPEEAFQGGLDFVRWLTIDNGLVGYTDPKDAGATIAGKYDQFKFHTATLSAQGALVRMLTAHDPEDPFFDLAAKRIVEDLPRVSKDRLSVDYTYWHWASIALCAVDGPDAPKKKNKYWPVWNKALVEAVLGLQDHTERSCTNGGWQTPDRWSYVGGTLATTALNVLTLESYYRHANPFSSRASAPVAAAFLSGTDEAAFKASMKRVRDAAAEKNADDAAAFDDAIAYYRELHVTSDASAGDVEFRLREDLAGFGTRECLRLVEGLIQHNLQKGLAWIAFRARALQPDRTCSEWLASQFVAGSKTAGHAAGETASEAHDLGTILRVNSTSAFAHAQRGSLERCREMLASSEPNAIAIATSIAESDAVFEAAAAQVTDAEAKKGLVRAKGQFTRAEAGARGLLEGLSKPRTAKDWWRLARELRGKLIEMDSAGMASKAALHLDSSPVPSPAPVAADENTPADLQALQAAALVLGSSRCLERGVVAHFLHGHPEIVFVATPGCRLALWDTRNEEPGLILAGNTYLDPYFEIVAR